jgi:REP element-mobilizing transposase RayT
MPVRIFAHLSWTTFARLPLVTAPVTGFLTKFLPAECARHGVRVLALGIVHDHVHVVLELPPRFDIPRLVQGLKGASARLANRDGIAERDSLRWAQGYDLRSVSPRNLRAAVAYVHRQHERHPPPIRGLKPRLGGPHAS